MQNVSSDEYDISVESDNKLDTSTMSQDVSLQILAELKHLSGRIQHVKEKVGKQETSKPSPARASQLPHTAAIPSAGDVIRRHTAKGGCQTSGAQDTK